MKTVKRSILCAKNFSMYIQGLIRLEIIAKLENTPKEYDS